MPLPYHSGNQAIRPQAREDLQRKHVQRLEDRVRRKVLGAVRVNRSRLAKHTGLDAASRSTSKTLHLHGDRGASASHLRLTLHEEQITDVNYLPFTFQVSVTGSIPDAILDFIKDESAGRGMTHVGVGAAAMGGEEALVTVILLRRFVTISSFPREVEPGSEQLLWIRPASELVGNPRVILSPPDGKVIEVNGERQREDCRFPLNFDRGPGRYVIQVLADDIYGVQITNQMDVWVGQPPMRVDKVVSNRDWGGPDVETQEARMIEMVNEFRVSHGRSYLDFSETLERSARAHSEDMRDGGFFGHRSPARGDLSDRLHQVPAIRNSLVLENIAMSVSVELAHDGLVTSPSHRRTLLDVRSTHLGVGIAIGNTGPLRVVYVTQLFGRLP